MVKRLASRQGLSGSVNSEIFIKFGLGFLSRAHETRRTHAVQTSLNGYSPEFFDYFDVECPLIAAYSPSCGRTVSLAEQLEKGHVAFEVWARFVVDARSGQKGGEMLLGTCVVPLEPLLENRIGIRGWLPVQAGVEKCGGGLEVVIRFTRHGDYLRIIDTAKEIGWSSGKEYERIVRFIIIISSIQVRIDFHLLIEQTCSKCKNATLKR